MTKYKNYTYIWEITVFGDKVSLSCGFWTSGVLLCTSENICILLWKTGVDPFFRDSVDFIHGLMETITDSCTTLQYCFWWITLGILVLPYIEGHYKKELYRLAIIPGRKKKKAIPKGWWKRAWEGTVQWTRIKRTNKGWQYMIGYEEARERMVLPEPWESCRYGREPPQELLPEAKECSRCWNHRPCMVGAE